MPPINVTNTAPTAADDSFEMMADNTLIGEHGGRTLSNDTDLELQAISVGEPRPQSGPSHGSLTVNGDGSFTYTPTPGYSGPDTFTYTAVDAGTTSAPATVTILVRDQSLISVSGWGTSFDPGRYLELDYPAYLPAGAEVDCATLHFSYRSLDAAGGTLLLYYIETRSGGSVVATHGNAFYPIIDCNSGSCLTRGRRGAARARPRPHWPTTSRSASTCATPQGDDRRSTGRCFPSTTRCRRRSGARASTGLPLATPHGDGSSVLSRTRGTWVTPALRTKTSGAWSRYRDSDFRGRTHETTASVLDRDNFDPETAGRRAPCIHDFDLAPGIEDEVQRCDLDRSAGCAMSLGRPSQVAAVRPSQ